jgi:hypothetical protein
MKIRILGPALLAVFALSAIVATAAQASEGPFYNVNGIRLGAGGKEEIAAKVQTEYKLETITPFVTITCTAQKLAKGSVIIGSAKGSAGTSTETIEFEGCALKGNNAHGVEGECRLAAADKGVIQTEPVKNTLDYPKKAPAKGDVLLVLFQPEKGSVLVKPKVEDVPPGECAIKPTLTVEGSVAAEAWDNNQKAIKLEEEPAEEKVGYVNFPVKGTEACAESAKVVTCIKPKLIVQTKTARLTGTSEIQLVSKLKWGVFGK